MKSNEKCYLCEEKSHVENVTEEHKEYVDVLCFDACPQYQISIGAIKKLKSSPLKRAEVFERVRQISRGGGKPVVGFDAIKGEFRYSDK